MTWTKSPSLETVEDEAAEGVAVAVVVAVAVAVARSLPDCHCRGLQACASSRRGSLRTFVRTSRS